MKILRILTLGVVNVANKESLLAQAMEDCMNSKIIILPNLADLKVNPDYRVYEVSEELVNDLLSHMLTSFGETVEVDTEEENCGLLCTKEDGEEIYLYPDLGIPGIEVKSDWKGTKKGDRITVDINGKEITVSISKILVNRSCSEEKVAEKAGISGVTNLAELKTYLREKEENKNKEANLRQLVMEMHDYLASHCTAEIDEAEITAWTAEQARLSYDENMSMGIDLRFTDSGEMLSEEEVLKNLAMDLRAQFIASLVDQKYAEELGYVPDEEALRNSMMEELSAAGITDPTVIDNNLKMAVMNDCFRVVYENLNQKAKEVLG